MKNKDLSKPSGSKQKKSKSPQIYSRFLPQNILDAFEGFIYVCSEEYKIEYMNNSFIKRTGYNATGDLCYKALHERDTVCPWCVNERVFAGETVKWEIKSPKDNRWYYIINTPLKHPDGTVSKQSVIIDITDRKNVETFLAESEKKYIELFQNSLDGVYITSKDGEIIDINRAAEELFGFTRDELVGKNILQLYAKPEDRKKFQKEVEEKKSLKNFTVKLKKKSGEIMDCFLTASLRLTADGEIEGYQGIVRDVTRENDAAIAIMESEAKYRKLFQDSPVALLEVDMSGIKQYINRLKEKGVKRIKSFFDKNPEKFLECSTLLKIINVNRATLDLFIAEDREALQQSLNDMYSRGITYDVLRDSIISITQGEKSLETEIITKTLTGDTKHLVLRWFVEPGQEYTLSRVLVSFVDITNLKALESERSNLTYMLAHDIKSALLVIQGFATRTLNKNFSLDEESLEKYLTIIKKESSKLEFLIEEFLTFSKIRSGKMQLRFSPVCIDREIIEIIDSYEQKASQSNITIQLNNSDTIPIIQADLNLLRRVFANLIDNAIKYSYLNSTVIISANENGDFVEVMFADQGRGISEEDMPFLFQPFHRGINSGKEKGYGIGLATVKAIVDGHGGKILVESQVEQGTVFTVCLPKEAQIKQSF